MGSALLTVIALILILHYTRRRWAPVLFRFLIAQIAKRMQRPAPHPHSKGRHREGETFVDPRPQPDKEKKKAKKSPGEYVDFEEIN